MTGPEKYLADNVMALLPPIIVIWSGTLENVPTGWSLCDGTGGTPDLKNKFIVGAKAGRPPGSEGGQREHDHNVSGFTHYHTFIEGSDVELVPGNNINTYLQIMTGTTNLKTNLPEYYALAYIMKD